jgi:transposase
MKRFIEGEDRSQITLFPDRLEDYVAEDNPVRAVDAFVDQLDLIGLGFSRVVPQRTGHPSYRCADLLKLHIYGYLNRVQSSRRLEREAARSLGQERRNPLWRRRIRFTRKPTSANSAEFEICSWK